MYRLRNNRTVITTGNDTEEEIYSQPATTMIDRNADLNELGDICRTGRSKCTFITVSSHQSLHCSVQSFKHGKDLGNKKNRVFFLFAEKK